MTPRWQDVQMAGGGRRSWPEMESHPLLVAFIDRRLPIIV